MIDESAEIPLHPVRIADGTCLDIPDCYGRQLGIDGEKFRSSVIAAEESAFHPSDAIADDRSGFERVHEVGHEFGIILGLNDAVPHVPPDCQV